MNLNFFSIIQGALCLSFILSSCRAPLLPPPQPRSQKSIGSADAERSEDADHSEDALPHSADEEEVSEDALLIPVMASDAQWGEAVAPVTLVQFADLECPFSGRAAPTVNALRNRYGPDKLRVVFKSNPLALHKQAPMAHEAAVAVHTIAGPGPFLRFTDLVFSRQSEISAEKLESWAEEVGVPVSELRRELESGRPAAKVAADRELARTLGVRGAPEFFINGVSLSGAQPEAEFIKLIDRELEAADQLTRMGVEKTAVYPRRLRVNFKSLAAREEAARTKELTLDPERARFRVSILSTDPVRGPQDALVTIVMFSEFQCPFSKRAVPTLERVRNEYSGDVRIVYKDNPLPFHNHAEPAAKVARYILKNRGDEAFWRTFDEFFAKQAQLRTPQAVEALYEGLLKTEGLTLAAYKQSNLDAIAREISASRKLAVNAEAHGTPYFFINGLRFPGAQSFENFKLLIDSELRMALRIVAEGTPRSAVYDALMDTAEDPAKASSGPQ